MSSDELNKSSALFKCFAAAVLAALYSAISLYNILSFLAYKLRHFYLFLSKDYISGRNFRGLSKKPSHLAVVLSEQIIRYPDLAKLILWCHEADIRYVTLYEPSGTLKKSPNEFLEAAGKLARGKFRVKLHFFSIDGHKELASHNNVQNDVHVHLAASEDGRGAIVEAARRLHENQSLVTIQGVDKMLKVTCDWPEPDLLIRCGGMHSHLGFLPWALRLTEFADLYSHHFLFPSEFRHILERFGKIDRRCGR